MSIQSESSSQRSRSTHKLLTSKLLNTSHFLQLPGVRFILRVIRFLNFETLSNSTKISVETIEGLKRQETTVDPNDIRPSTLVDI